MLKYQFQKNNVHIQIGGTYSLAAAESGLLVLGSGSVAATPFGSFWAERRFFLRTNVAGTHLLWSL
jgi:hypothetical protein